jgi:hypothetical protein
MHSLQRSWVRSQHPSAQWNLKCGRWSRWQMNIVRKKKNILNKKKILSEFGPQGSGLVAMYQKFEYAVGHWLQKATEDALGNVLCAPGCFSLYRLTALVESRGSSGLGPAFQAFARPPPRHWTASSTIRQGGLWVTSEMEFLNGIFKVSGLFEISQTRVYYPNFSIVQNAIHE